MGRKSERWAERLLDAAAGHESWETVGQELRDVLGTPLAGVQLRDELGRPVEVALALDVEPAALRAYAEEFHAEDPHGPAMLGRSAYEVVDSDSLLPRRELMRSRYYQARSGPQSARWSRRWRGRSRARTVHVHFRRLFQKVGVRRAAELVATVLRVLPQWR